MIDDYDKFVASNLASYGREWISRLNKLTSRNFVASRRGRERELIEGNESLTFVQFLIYIRILLSIQETRVARIFIKEFHAGREIFFFRTTRYRFSIGSVGKVEEGRLFWQTKRRYIYVIGERWIILWNISSDRNRVTLSSLWKRLASI